MPEWFDRQAGSPVAKSKDDPTMLMVSLEDKPDWIGVPEEIGGGQYRCEEVFAGRCLCGDDHNVKHYTLLGSDFQVAECKVKGFLWYRHPSNNEGG